MVTNSPITSALLRKCQERGECATTTMVCESLGQAVDAGLIALPDLLAMVKSCSTPDQLGDMLVMLAATVNGMSEGRLAIQTGGDTWTL